jgi:CheY-like chemotaxis protein
MSIANPAHPLHGLRILVVDDDAHTRDAVSALLELNGASVRTAQSASHAREVLHRFRADLVISDLAMPGGDGIDLIMSLRKLPPELGGRAPAIAVSGTPDDMSRARALAYGFQEYLNKPVNPSQLLELVASLTGRAPA